MSYMNQLKSQIKILDVNEMQANARLLFLNPKARFVADDAGHLKTIGNWELAERFFRWWRNLSGDEDEKVNEAVLSTLVAIQKEPRPSPLIKVAQCILDNQDKFQVPKEQKGFIPSGVSSSIREIAEQIVRG